MKKNELVQPIALNRTFFQNSQKAFPGGKEEKGIEEGKGEGREKRRKKVSEKKIDLR